MHPNSSRLIARPASRTTGFASASVDTVESPLEILLHKRRGQFGGVGFKEPPKCLGQQIIEIGRIPFRNQRARARPAPSAARFDSDPFHAVKTAP